MNLIERKPTRVRHIKEVPALIIRKAKEILKVDDDSPDEVETALRLQVGAKLMADILAGGFYTQLRSNAADRRRYRVRLKGLDDRKYWVELDYFFPIIDDSGEYGGCAKLSAGDYPLEAADQRIFATNFRDKNSEFPDIVRRYSQVKGSFIYRSPSQGDVPKFKRPERFKFLQELFMSQIDTQETQKIHDSIKSRTKKRHRLHWVYTTDNSLPRIKS